MIETVHQVSGERVSETDGWLIHKAGRGWYRSNAQGYTNDIAQAGRYSRADADAYSHPNGWDGPRDEITIRHESELVALSSPAPEQSAEAVAWRCEDLILPAVSIIDDREHAQMRMSQPHAWRVTPLYATPPSPKPEAVSDEMVDRAHAIIERSFQSEVWEFGPPSTLARKVLVATALSVAPTGVEVTDAKAVDSQLERALLSADPYPHIRAARAALAALTSTEERTT